MVNSDSVIEMKSKLIGISYLLTATVIWGSAFSAQSVGMDYIGPFTFQAIRGGLAIVFLFPVSYLLERDKSAFRQKWVDKKLWKAGIPAGIALFLAAGMQQVGLIDTSAGKAGFLTAMYIVLVPVGGLFFGKKLSLTAWLSVIIAVVGLYFLSGAGLSAIQTGDLLMIGCAFWFAVQITIVDRMGLQLDGVRLNCVQSLVCALLSAIVTLFTEQVDIHAVLQCWFPLVYAGVVSMGIAYTLQIFGQQRLDPTQASILMSLESVFALIFGWLLLHERMSTMELTGCALMFIAVLLSQIPKKSPA